MAYLELLNSTLAGEALLDKHTNGGEHGKAAILQLLKLELTELSLAVWLPGLWLYIIVGPEGQERCRGKRDRMRGQW